MVIHFPLQHTQRRFRVRGAPFVVRASVINRESPTQLLAAGEPYNEIWPVTESSYVYDIGATS